MIRAATPADAPALRRLQTHLREPSPDLLEGALSGDDLSVARVLVSTETEETPVAYLLAVPGQGTTYVAELVVDPAHRREGRAAALLTACADDDTSLTVTVAPDNEAARALYRDYGFEKVGRLPGFFADGPALRYRRD